MNRIDSRVTRWRIMIGLSTDHAGKAIDVKRAYEDALVLADGALDSFNVTRGVGFWNSHEEESLVIEHLGFDTDADKVRALAEAVVKYLDQAEVWVTSEPVTLTRYVR